MPTYVLDRTKIQKADNTLINPATEEKQDDIVTAIGAIASDGLTDAELRAADVKVTLDGESVPVTGPLTDIELRATAVPVTGTFYPATQPVSITTMPSTPVTGTFWQTTQPVSLTTLPTVAVSATAVDATASGDNTIVAITNSPRLYYISLSANGANSADVTAIVKVGASTKYKVSLKAGAIWARNIGAGNSYITGTAGDDIVVNLSAAQTVHVSVEYADV